MNSLMFRYSLILIALFSLPFVTSAQTDEGNEDQNAIAFNAIVPELGDDFNARNQQILQTRLDQITTNYGTGGTNFNPNFVLVPSVIINGYETVGGAPPRTLAKLDVILKTGNAETKTKFTSLSLKTNGVGENKAEALHNALSKLETRNDKLKDFMESSKQEVVEYYKNNCDNILQKARSSADAQKFEKAFSHIYSIPASSGCYDKAQEMVGEVFSEFQEAKCAKLITSARAAHGAGHMDQAARFLSLVPTNSECQEDAKKLANKMEDERLMKYKKEVEVRKLKAKAARDIAVAFAKNQPDKVVDVNFLHHHH